MRPDEKIYNEYAGWQLENNDLLKTLKSDGINIYDRIKHVFDVIDYLYVKLTEDNNYSEEEDQIFKTGYFYVAHQLNEISHIVKTYYNNDYKLANSKSHEINLLLNTKDFQAEVFNSNLTENNDVKELLKFDQKILNYLNKNNEVPKKIYDELDELLSKIFDYSEINYLTVNNIFLEIADELNIL